MCEDRQVQRIEHKLRGRRRRGEVCVCVEIRIFDAFSR